VQQALSDDNKYVNKHETDSNLCEQGVELLVGIIVTALGQVGLDLLTHLLFIQVPAVVIVCARSCRRIGSTWQTITQHYDAPNAGFMHTLNKLQLIESKCDEFPNTVRKRSLKSQTQHSLVNTQKIQVTMADCNLSVWHDGNKTQRNSCNN
jgi:hypothetical protein